MSSHGPGCEMADTVLECPAVVPAHMLMCRPHWYMVPQAIRRRVWSGHARGLDSPQYRAAVKAAVSAVLAKVNP